MPIAFNTGQDLPNLFIFIVLQISRRCRSRRDDGLSFRDTEK